MWIAVGIIVIVLFVIVMMYNSLIGKRNQVQNVFATCDTLLKKRYDVLPNLVETVKGYMQHERQLLERVTEMRARAMGSGASDATKIEADNMLTPLLGQLFAAVENYPQLKASDNFMHLQRTLNELEEQISAARRAYNAAVLDFNNAVQMFPTNVLASMFGFQTKTFFEIAEGERANVDVRKALDTKAASQAHHL